MYLPRVDRERRSAWAMRLDRASDVIGVVTLAFGCALSAGGRPIAEALRLDPARGRAIGLADLALGTALLAARPRWPWMAVRAALNVLIAREYRAELHRRSGADRVARFGVISMRTLAVSDAAMAAALRAAGR